MSSCDLLIRGGHLATMVANGDPYGVVRDGAIVIDSGRISWVGPEAELPPAVARTPAASWNARGRWVTPGLVDCHTHLVFGGNRASEFEARLGGLTYEEIARAGGGILSTVSATRAASDDDLLETGRARLSAMCSHGVTTAEIKSGYGLELSTELRMLRVARELEAALPVTVQTSLLGAHTLPPEFKKDRDGYVDLVCTEMIPMAASEGLADAVDAFCERIAFTPEEVGRVFEAAEAHGLPVRLHADQLSDLGGAALAARHGARSADHLEHASEDGVRAMADAGTVAVLLPGAFHFLGGGRRPPVASMRASGVDVAVASDLNPGTSPVVAPLVVLNLACTLFGLTPEQALAGMTRVAARALGLEDEIGTLEVGKKADLAVWDVREPAELSYWLGANPCVRTVHGGILGTERVG